MLVIRLLPTDRATRYCNRDNIDLIRIQEVLNFTAQYIDSRKKLEVVNITFDIDCRKEDSEYNFKSKHIVIAGISYNDKKIKTRAGRLKYLIEHTVHEFRHCMQEVMFKKDASDITYGSSSEDEYETNPLEIDAMWFEKKFTKKAVELYKALKRAKIKNSEIYHG